jgi:outer membrane protein TolC
MPSFTRSCRVLLAAALCAFSGGRAHAAHEVSLSEALGLAEKNSPGLKAAALKEQAARAGVDVARAGYLPSVALDAVDSWGFPGSSGYLGIGGLAGSPYRSGAAADLVAHETLFDFGRTRAGVKAAEDARKARHEEIALGKYSVDADVLQTFYQCARFRSDHEVWDNLHGDTELVAQEVRRYVNTGQRSLVDRYLSDAQVEEARTNRNYFKSRMTSTVKRLSLLMGVPEGDLACPALPALGERVPLAPGDGPNPYVARSQADVDAAKNKLSAAKTDYLPKLVGMASVGGMDKVRLVTRTDYSAGVGLIVPLFDGFGTVNRVRQARAQVDATTQELGEVDLQMRELNAKYDEIIDASQARIEHLQREQTLAQEGFSVAKNRYFKFQGTLVDLRDALRNVGRIQIEMRDTQADLLEASGAKALLAGGKP